MKLVHIYLFAIPVCALMSSCQSAAILSAGFESDVINNPPATNLSGAPSGDVIQYNAALDPQLKVQNSTIAGSKALHFTNIGIADVPALERWVKFKGIGTDLTKTIWFTHTGQNTGASHDLFIDLTDGFAHLFARMRISSDGQVALAKNLADNYTDVIGNIGSQVHTIIFTTTPSVLKYNVTIFTTNGPTITVENKPMITTDALSFNNPAYPTLSFQHSKETGSGQTYAIGSVSISKKKP